MAGYSGKPLRQKLGFTAGQRLAIFNPPENYFDLLDDLNGLDFAADFDEPLDAAHIFVTEYSELRQLLPGILVSLAPRGMIWVSWPKGASKVPTDLNENVIRELALAQGLVDVKVCAVDDIWSGLKLVRRRNNQ